MTRTSLIFGAVLMGLNLLTLVTLWIWQSSLQAAPQAPPAPTIAVHVDNTHGAVCWVASSPHGVGISCLKSGPGEFGP